MTETKIFYRLKRFKKIDLSINVSIKACNYSKYNYHKINSTTSSVSNLINSLEFFKE